LRDARAEDFGLPKGGNFSAVGDALQDHLVDTSGAHAATAISYAGSGAWADTTTIPSGTVEAAIDQIVADLATLSTNGGAAKVTARDIYDLTDGTVYSMLNELSGLWGKLDRSNVWTAVQIFDGTSGDNTQVLETQAAFTVRKCVWRMRLSGEYSVRLYETKGGLGSGFEITINAEWNTGTTNWEGDSTSDDAFLTIFDANGVTLYKKDDTSSPWADTDVGWDTGFVRMNSEVPSASTSVRNTVNRKNICKAHGVASSEAGGTVSTIEGFNSQASGSHGGSGGTIQILIGADMANANYTVQVQIESYSVGATGVPTPFISNKAVGSFTITFEDTSGAGPIDLSTGDLQFNWTVFGEQ
jgi:hypothetical protein